MPDRPTFIIELADTGDGPPPIIRLRRLLKTALRVFGFKAVEVKEHPQPQEHPHDQTQTP